MSTILDHPEAQALLDQTEVSPDSVRSCTRQLTRFVQRYLPCFDRDEQRRHADTILRGKRTGLQRQTTEPMARHAGQKRRPLHHFVGAGRWDDDAVRTELRRPVRQELADPDAVLVLDGHGVPKQGDDSCGVDRQWCGRLGQVANCPVGYFRAYAAPQGQTVVAARLYLTQERAQDRRHRQKTYVPPEVVFQAGGRLGLDLVRTAGRERPHGWVAGADEFGRASAWRAHLRLDGERYVLDVPSNTLVRDLSDRRPPVRAGGRERRPVFARAEVWAARQPKGRWRKFRLRDGTKGRRDVKALPPWVQTKDADGCAGPRERLVVLRTWATKPQTWYTLSNAPQEVPLVAVVRAHGERQGVDELFEDGNQEVGLNHDEVRSWTGWRHHLTLALLALWFSQLERRRLGEKKSGGDGSASAADLHGVVAVAAAPDGDDRGPGECGAAA